MPETKRPLKIFLSYASQDKPIVRELSRQLVGEGWIDTWQDEKNLLPGQDWRVKIEEAVEEADVVIIVLSQHSVSKEGHVQKELRYAREIALEKPEDSIFLIPLRLDECEVPRGLRFYQWVDYFGDEKDASYRALVASLNLRYEQKLKAEDVERLLAEKLKRESVEKAAREKAKREALEKARRLKAEEEERQRIAKEKTARDKAEKEAAQKTRLESGELARQKVAEEKADREFSQRAVHEKAIYESAGKANHAANTNIFSGIGWVIGAFGVIGTVVTIVVIGLLSLKGLELNIFPTPTKPFVTTLVAQLPTEITDAKGVPMILVPSGKFTMGNDNYGENEKPVHQVYLDSYYIDVYEVTNIAYKVCVDNGICQLPSDIVFYNDITYSQHPVANVDWVQAKTYCEWRNARLPSEADWEKAARGTDQRTYPWGEDSMYSDRANIGLGEYTEAVGSYEDGKSPYGIYDMAGNVWEWTSSLYLPYPYDVNDGRESISSSGDYVVRGGKWGGDYYANSTHSSYRVWFASDFTNPLIGVRCARDANP